MIKRFITLVFYLSLSSSAVFSAQGVLFYVADGDVEAKYERVLDEKIESIGWSLSDSHERINDAYAQKFGDKESPDYDKEGWSVSLDNLGFYSVSNDEALRPLLIKSPEIGGFSPFNLLFFKRKNEERSYVGHITPQTMLDIVETTDKSVRDDFKAMFTPLDKMLQSELSAKLESTTYSKLPTETMLNFEISFDRPAELTEFIESFQEEFERVLKEKEYVITGYKDFKEIYSDMELEFNEFDAYFVYSFCHFRYSYSIFRKGHPDAGVFAPCSMYMYVKKDSNTLVIGMPKLSNWIFILDIKDEVMKKLAFDLDDEIVSIMKSLGAKAI